MEFKELMELYIDDVNAELEKLFVVPDCRQRSVYEAMRYSALAGGKRIRPMIALAVCDMLEGDRELAMRFGTGIECIHTYSLIHDDLPCMDNDDLRRGMPTCHKRFGEATALLAGDGLLTAAFEHMADIECADNSRSGAVMRFIAEAARAAGCMGMIGGQVVDIESENAKDADIERLEYMYSGKTGALIRLSALAGAVAADADKTRTDAVLRFADSLGFAFQIKDDILDFEGDEAVLGKPTGSDAENNKTTYVTLCGMSEAKRKLKELTAEAETALSIFGEKADFLRELAKYLLERSN